MTKPKKAPEKAKEPKPEKDERQLEAPLGALLNELRNEDPIKTLRELAESPMEHGADVPVTATWAPEHPGTEAHGHAGTEAPGHADTLFGVSAEPSLLSGPWEPGVIDLPNLPDDTPLAVAPVPGETPPWRHPAPCVVCGTAVSPGEVCVVDGHRAE